MQRGRAIWSRRAIKCGAGHPILIDRRYWGELLALPDDGAPRDVINAHSVTHVNVDSDSVLRDVDTPQDYSQERSRAGLKSLK